MTILIKATQALHVDYVNLHAQVTPSLLMMDELLTLLAMIKRLATRNYGALTFESV